jgi:hypothetical protein
MFLYELQRYFSDPLDKSQSIWQIIISQPLETVAEAVQYSQCMLADFKKIDQGSGYCGHSIKCYEITPDGKKALKYLREEKRVMSQICHKTYLKYFVPLRDSKLIIPLTEQQIKAGQKTVADSKQVAAALINVALVTQPKFTQAEASAAAPSESDLPSLIACKG